MDESNNHSSQEPPESDSSWGGMAIAAVVLWDIGKGIYWYCSGKSFADYFQTIKYTGLILLAVIALMLIFGNKEKLK
jgi:high-affinity Fe2+/Pb2+ permease